MGSPSGDTVFRFWVSGAICGRTRVRWELAVGEGEWIELSKWPAALTLWEDKKGLSREKSDRSVDLDVDGADEELKRGGSV